MHRTDPKRLRQDYINKLTNEEVVELGARLAAGANHFRAWVGPPFVYDLSSALQFQMLTNLGLRDYHRLLDIGCGSLRVGRLLIIYLLPNRYFGIEPNQKILHEGIEQNFGASIKESEVIKYKKPNFAHNENFDFSFVGKSVDYIVAQSIVSHAGVAETKKLLQNIAAVSHDHTIALVTYIRCEQPDKSNKADGWFYPACVTYSDEDFAGMAHQAGFKYYRISWPLFNQRQDGLITTQTPALLCKSDWTPSVAQRLSGLYFEDIRET